MDKRKILIVDDDQGVCSALSAYLQGKGYETDVSFDGVNAPRKVLTFKPDLILLDHMLPGADARTLFERLQKSDDTKNVPVIIMAGIPIDHLRTYMPESPKLAYMNKPVDYTELDEKIRKFLGSGSAPGDPGSGKPAAGAVPAPESDDAPTIIDLDAEK